MYYIGDSRSRKNRKPGIPNSYQSPRLTGFFTGFIDGLGSPELRLMIDEPCEIIPFRVRVLLL
jgi:hypothetical protein